MTNMPVDSPDPKISNPSTYQSKSYTISLVMVLSYKSYLPPHPGTYHADPDSPAVYMAQSNTPISFRAQNTPLRETMARNPPPEPRIAIEGT